MSLNRYVRQLKPIQENKVNYVDIIQNLQESKTEQDLVEQTIAVEYNKLKGHSDPIRAANLDAESYGKISEKNIIIGQKVAKNLHAKYSKIKVLKHFGRKGEDKKLNQYKELYPELNVKDATAKTDIGDGGEFNLSLKEAKGSQLMSPKGAESTGLVKSAIDRCNNLGVKIIGDGSKAIELLSGTLDKLSVKQMYITVGGGKVPGAKNSFIEWYLEFRGKELSKDRNAKINFKTKKNVTDEERERHMKAELSVFKITNQDRDYRKKQIPKVNFIKDINPYFTAYVKDGNVDIGKYRIPDRYFKSQQEKDLAYKDVELKKKVVEILGIAIKQTQFLKDLADEFTGNKELAKYIIYEAATGLAKFTGDVKSEPPYKGSDNFVAKYMMTYDADSGAVAPLEDCWSWAQNNYTSLTTGLNIDFKSSQTSRAGYTKFAVSIAKKVLNMDYEPQEYDMLSEIFDEEYAKISPTLYQYEKEIDMLNEGLLDYVRKGYRSVVDAISKIKQKIVDTLIKFLKKIFVRIVEYLKQLFKTNVSAALDFLEVEVDTGSFQIVYK